MGSYRTEDAAGIALLLGALTLALMTIADRFAGQRA
jgi:ABC-type Fe3+ transport system permease subunit